MNKDKNQEKIRFSIGTKLIIIISCLVIISLGSITALVSWMVREDLRIAAEENNFEANRRAAAETEDTLTSKRAASAQLIHTINILGAESAGAREAAEFFFANNPRIAALVYTSPHIPTPHILTNSQFFLSRNIDPTLAEVYFNENQNSLLRAAAGERALLNAAPLFERAFLAMFFPWHGRGLGGSAGIIFDAENLVDNFGFGVNQSFLLNRDGDILVHSDFALLKTGVNAAGWDFIQRIQEAPERNKQELIYADLRFEQEEILTRCYVAFSKLADGNIVITGIEYDKVFEGIAATTRRNIYLTGAVLFISVMFIWFFAKTISLPLKVLTGAAKNIEGGQFDLESSLSHLKGRDEIGVLGKSFKKMSLALNIFGRFTNREIAVKAMRGEIKPGGLPKHATIFFSDIRNFTAISENFTKTFGSEASDKIVFWLNDYLKRMVECVEKTEGVVDKFIGDAVMAHWGTAYSSGSPAKDAFNCVKAALMMRQALISLNKERAAGDPANPHIQIGCGINSGIVTAGQIGSDLRMEYTVIGDPVNLASRVESLTKELNADILISENTWKLVGNHFITEEMPPVTVKGKVKPVRVFAVVNIASAKAGPRSLAEVRKMLGLENA